MVMARYSLLLAIIWQIRLHVASLILLCKCSVWLLIATKSFNYILWTTREHQLAKCNIINSEYIPELRYNIQARMVDYWGKSLSEPHYMRSKQWSLSSCLLACLLDCLLAWYLIPLSTNQSYIKHVSFLLSINKHTIQVLTIITNHNIWINVV